MEYLPPTTLAIMFIAFGAARFENQRWIRARSMGMKGANQAIGTFVDLTGFVALLFAGAFLIAYAVDQSILQALVLFGCGVAGVLAVSVPIGLLFGGDNWLVWIVGTVAVWPLGLALIPWVSWFGVA
ncbi:hypothetical protein CKO28_02995 [Rhodovibrio sodomensis]|uniref:DUF3325 domain-containing protein n=1 Tax=Rhodovibrio sodomensis TaxID=1088 RepID=A0ABS1DC89_9PROT|nr:hypothetical protein [Rhodovibrio sodomensis]MBK1667010.1 hypothetical protein [Rhodovibrio sodomensis]